MFYTSATNQRVNISQVSLTTRTVFGLFVPAMTTEQNVVCIIVLNLLTQRDRS